MADSLTSEGRWLVGYIVRRVSPVRLLLPLAVAFACSVALYVSSSTSAPPSTLTLTTCGITFALLFIQLRLIDDLDDLDHDHPGITTAALNERERMRRRLKIALVAVFISLVSLNLSPRRMLFAVVLSSAISYVGPFLIKRHCPPVVPFLILGFVFFEGAPFAFFLYAYVALAGGHAATAVLPWIPVTSTFWLGYEFWKFSRRAHLNESQPYLLAPRGLRLALTALLLGGLAANLLLVHSARFAPAIAVYLAALPIGFAFWLNYQWARVRAQKPSRSSPRWTGMAYLVALELGIAAQLLLTRGA